jgi:tRNA-dihydrouridine synthase B
VAEVRDIMLAHLRDLYDFYGPEAGVRIARKHIGWYCRERPQALAFRQSVMHVESAEGQLARVRGYFDALEARSAAAA